MPHSRVLLSTAEPLALRFARSRDAVMSLGVSTPQESVWMCPACFSEEEQQITQGWSAPDTGAQHHRALMNYFIGVHVAITSSSHALGSPLQMGNRVFCVGKGTLRRVYKSLEKAKTRTVGDLWMVGGVTMNVHYW